MSETEQDPIRIIVVGAGVSGLTGASKIIAEFPPQQKVELHLLEALPTPGGRLRSFNLPNDPENGVINLGANWVHGIRDNPVYKILQENGTTMHKSVDGFHIPAGYSHVFDSGGNRIPPSVVDENYQVLDKIYSDLEDSMKVAPPFTTSAEENELKSQDFDFAQIFDSKVRESLGSDLLKRDNYSVPSQMYRLFRWRLGSYNGFNLEQLSFHFWKSDWDSTLQGDHVFVSNYRQLIDHLIKLLTKSTSSNIYCNSRVQTIEKVTENNKVVLNVTVENTEEKETKVLKADYVLVTVPIGILKSETLKFIPDLSPKKQKAIQNIGIGVYEILSFGFDEAFWVDPKSDDEPQWIEIGESEITEGYPLLLVNYHKYFKKPVLLAHLWGDQARQMCKCSDEEAIDKMNNLMKKLYPNKAKPIQWLKLTKWHLEDSIRTSFSAMKLGCSTYDFDRLAQPEYDGHLYFSGEATYRPNFGTVNAAYASGEIAAEKILSKIRESVSPPPSS